MQTLIRLLTAASTPRTRQQLVDEINASPGVLWKASVQPRFAGSPIGASKNLLGSLPLTDAAISLGVAAGTHTRPSAAELAAIVASDIPASFDSAANWPECVEVIGDIRDQSDCGCCWAFAAAEAASDRLCIFTKGAIKVPLSAQDVCFCDSSAGCNGGTVDQGWAKIQSAGVVTGGQYNSSGFGSGWCSDYSLPHCHHHGPVGSDPYPAEGTSGCPKPSTSPICPTTCGAQSQRTFDTDKYTFNGTVYLYGNGGEAPIQTAIMNQGPVEASFSVYADFENYASGIYHHVTGTTLGGHAIRIVGWGVDGDTKYWKVANSWNPYWGENGYFRILRGTNECSIESNVCANGPTATWGKM